MHRARWHLMALWAALCCLCLLAAPATAQTPPPDKVRALLEMLADPEVQRWVEQQRKAPAGGASAPAAAASAAPTMAACWPGRSMRSGSTWPACRRRCRRCRRRWPEPSPGCAPRWTRTACAASRCWCWPLSRWASASSGCSGSCPPARASASSRRGWRRRWSGCGRWARASCSAAAGSAAFALGTIGSFLAFDWPPVLRDVLLRLLVIVVMVRLSLTLGRLLFAPGAPRFRPLRWTRRRPGSGTGGWW
jgi:hypothetical protein